MRSTTLFLLAMFVSTAVVEFLVLRRWFGRRRLMVFVGSVSVLSGVFWLACALLLTWVNIGWKSASEPVMSTSDKVDAGLLLMLDAALLSVIALVPAGFVAAIYRRMKRQS